MKYKTIKRALAVVGAGLILSGSLAACANDNEDEVTTETQQEQQKDNSDAVKETEPAEAQTTAVETQEATEETTEEAVDDVYGDGVDPVIAKSDENGLSAFRDMLKSTRGAVCGFAYLGSVTDEATVKDVIEASSTAKRCPFIKDLDTEKIISDGGNDIFVFVPVDDESRVTVNTFAESDNGKSIYSSDKGNPFLVRTKDELNDSMEIIITDSAGNAATFTPDISTGSIVDVVYKDLLAYNFSTDVTESAGINKQYLLDIVKYREPDLNALMNEGTTLSSDSYNRIYIDDLEFYTLDFGHNEGDDYIKDRYYAVSKDGTLVYRYNPEVNDWVDLLAFDFNSAQYR